ncbi:MAG: SIMPL domain-containing protein [Acidobacteria bacterium]|nr:SIMPL domain-containing protein [Acidobacteriota bacterium]
MSKILSILLLSAVLCQGQVARRSVVRATGTSSVSFQPDQVSVNVGATTQGTTAQEAGDSNATLTTAVLAALRTLIGNNGTIRTINYSLGPVYRNTGGQSTIVAYQATNTVSVTVTNISMAGRIIDTAAGAGATTVQGVQFGLKDPNPGRAQALRDATIQAKKNAEAIAGGLGMRLGVVLVAEQGSAISVPIVRTAGLSASTPIEPGNVDISATVSVEVELVP